MKQLYELYPILENYTEKIIKEELGKITLPIDIEKIIQNYGIDLYKMNMSDNESGAITIKKDKCGIAINEKNSEIRQRFTMAHEFGHFISYRYQRKTGEIVEFRDGTSSLGINIEEIFANKFAALILMPKSVMISLVRHLNNKELATVFLVSEKAVTNRIRNLWLKNE